MCILQGKSSVKTRDQKNNEKFSEESSMGKTSAIGISMADEVEKGVIEKILE
jgi:hypothetical protein